MANCLATEMNMAQPCLARPPLPPGPSTCWHMPLPITEAGARVWAEAVLAERQGAEVWVPSPGPPCLRVQTEAVAVLLRSQQGGRDWGEVDWVQGPPLL